MRQPKLRSNSVGFFDIVKQAQVIIFPIHLHLNLPFPVVLLPRDTAIRRKSVIAVWPTSVLLIPRVRDDSQVGFSVVKPVVI